MKNVEMEICPSKTVSIPTCMCISPGNIPEYKTLNSLLFDN